MRPRRGRLPLILGLWALPLSIAAAQFFLSIAALARIVRLIRRQTPSHLPRCLLAWLVWAVLASVLWVLSPEPSLGWSEIRHLLVLGVVFVTLPDLDRTADRQTAWRGIFVASSVSSLFVIGDFFWRLFYYRQELAAGGQASFYLRSGGLHHWMVYGTVEILVVAGLIGFWSFYPEQRRRWWPAAAINGLAIVLSLTRMVWITCLLMLGIHLVWKRSKWIWALPFVLLVLYTLAPAAVRERVAESFDPAYYANAERLQMLQVGWKMTRDHPWTGVGPGRVEKLYKSYLTAQDPVPAYHGHLHNNIAQIAAQFGIPALLAASLFVGVLLRDLLRARKAASSRDDLFTTETAVLALSGFLFAGLFEYTYGHSLGLMMIGFAVLPALLPHKR